MRYGYIQDVITKSITLFVAAREKTDDSAPRMQYLDIVEYAHKHEKLDREKIHLWMSYFRSNIVKVLSGFHRWVSKALISGIYVSDIGPISGS